jgi:hypothetical protein
MAVRATGGLALFVIVLVVWWLSPLASGEGTGSQTTKGAVTNTGGGSSPPGEENVGSKEDKPFDITFGAPSKAWCFLPGASPGREGDQEDLS